MKKYIGAVQNNRPSKTTGNAAVNATLTVRDARDGSKDSLYDDDFVAPISNPVKTDNATSVSPVIDVSVFCHTRKNTSRAS